MKLCGDPMALKRLTAIRELYEPHAWGLCTFLRMPLPQWIAEPKKTDAWKAVADLQRGARQDPEDALRATEHISEQSVSSHLHDEAHGL